MFISMDRVQYCDIYSDKLTCFIKTPFVNFAAKLNHRAVPNESPKAFWLVYDIIYIIKVSWRISSHCIYV